MSKGAGAVRPFVDRAIDNTTNATVYSGLMRLGRGSLMSFHLEWSGTPTSTLTLWVSNKEFPNTASDTDFVQVTEVDFTGKQPAGGAGKSFVNAGNAAGLQYRLKCVTASGSGTLNCWGMEGKNA